MTICREWSLVKNDAEIRKLRPLYCRSWTCDICAPRRRLQLMAACASGDPNRFITITVNPRIGTSPADRLRLLARAWRVAVQRIRRRYPEYAFNYFAIVEATENGEPHLHILVRGTFIPQAWLSAVMGEIIDSPIVDIRKIKNRKQVISYVAKYVTKAPAQFGTSKRYWHSRDYEIDKPQKSETPADAGVPWIVDQRPLMEILKEWTRANYAVRRESDDLLIGFLSPPRWE